MTMTGMTGANAMICSMPDSAMSISVRPELVEGLFFPGPVEGKDGPSTSSGQTGFGIQTTVSIAANIAEPTFSASSTWVRKRDRKSAAEGKGVYIRLDIGGSRYMTKKNKSQ